jgi:hypothetical protein
MGDRRGAHRDLAGTPAGKRPLRRLRPRREDNIKMSIQEVGWVDMDWIALVQKRDRWRDLVNTVMNHRAP